MTENIAEEDLYLVEVALRRVLRNTPYYYDPVGGDDDADSKLIRNEEDRQLVLRLLDQLNSLRTERDHNVLSSVTEKVNSDHSDPLDNFNNREDKLQAHGPTEADDKINNEEIIREIRHIKKQNKFTHVALSVIFATSSIWKLSEMAVALILRNKIIHPFRVIGDIIKLKEAGTKNIGSHLQHVEPPKLPHMEAPLIMSSVDNILNGGQRTGSSSSNGGQRIGSSSNGHRHENQPPLLELIFPKFKNS